MNPRRTACAQERPSPRWFGNPFPSGRLVWPAEKGLAALNRRTGPLPLLTSCNSHYPPPAAPPRPLLPRLHLVHGVVDQRQLQQRRLVPEVVELGAGDLSTRMGHSGVCWGPATTHSSTEGETWRQQGQRREIVKGRQRAGAAGPTGGRSAGQPHHCAGVKVDEVQLCSQLQVVLGSKPKLTLRPHLQHPVASGHMWGRLPPASGRAASWQAAIHSMRFSIPMGPAQQQPSSVLQSPLFSPCFSLRTTAPVGHAHPFAHPPASAPPPPPRRQWVLRGG